MSTTRSSNWSVTINNPTNKDEEEIALARQKGWKVDGQKEKGENGTEHYQLYVRTPQVRFSAVKKAFSRAHIEVARNPAALASYVTKEDTRVAALKTTQEQYPSQSQIWEWFAEECGSDSDLDSYVSELYKEHTQSVARDMSIKLLSKQEMREHAYLNLFDRMISRHIAQGYYCELIGVNPQIRSAVKKYGFSICTRYWSSRVLEKGPLETGRQSDTRLENEESIAVDITTLNADSEEEDEEDHNTPSACTCWDFSSDAACRAHDSF